MPLPMLAGESVRAYVERVFESASFKDAWRIVLAGSNGTRVEHEDSCDMMWKEAFAVAAQGLLCGVVFVVMLHLFSRPIGDSEVIGAAEVAALAARCRSIFPRR